MKTEVQDYTLVRISDNTTDEFAQAYWTSNGADALKQFHYAMEHDIIVNLKPKNDSDEPKEAFIQEIRINFGNEESLTTIELYADIL